MNKQEFLSKLSKGTRVPTDDEYLKIEYVYTWHPSISETDGKKQVVYLYSNFGMRIFDDMMKTAERAENLDSHIREHEAFLNDYKKQLKELKGE